MKTRNKTITTLFLLALTLAPLFYTLHLNLRQQSVRRRMKEELEEKMLHSLTLNSREIHWVREGKEIAVENRLFDVKSICYRADGTAILTGLFDEEETALVQQLQKQQQDNNEQGTRQLVKFFQLMLTLPETAPGQNNSFMIEDRSRFPETASVLPTRYRIILTPPPQAG